MSEIWGICINYVTNFNFGMLKSVSVFLFAIVLTEKGLLTRKQSIEHKRKASPEADKTL